MNFKQQLVERLADFNANIIFFVSNEKSNPNWTPAEHVNNLIRIRKEVQYAIDYIEEQIKDNRITSLSPDEYRDFIKIRTDHIDARNELDKTLEQIKRIRDEE